MINIDNYVNESKTEHDKNWPYIPDHPYRILIIGGLEYGKTNAFINFINEQNDIDKIYQYSRDLSEPKFEYAGIKHLNYLNPFIECSNTMDDVYKKINGYNPIRKRKKLIVFDSMNADIMTNKKIQSIIKELFIM